MLKHDGKLILSDIFVNGTEFIHCDDTDLFAHCLTGAMPKEKILESIKCCGFQAMLWEDHSRHWGVSLLN